MEIIWASWRGNYIKTHFMDKKKDCIFCVFNNQRIIDLEPSVKNLILYKSKRCFIMMNKYPYINGHLMVIPYKHTDNILELEADEKIDIFSIIQFSIQILYNVYKPDGFNIGINLGKVAGAGIDQHIHFHIVPRFNADHNFMTTVSNCRIINFCLEETYQDLYNAIKIIKKEG